jgi:hypothetical protein
VAPSDVQEQQPATGGGVSGSVEASRRHGAFDSRWPKRLRLVAADRLAPALTGLKDVPAGLDWDAFSTHSFPGRRRHDLGAISAYDAYKHGRPRSTRPLPRRRSIGPSETVLPRVDTERSAEPQRALALASASEAENAADPANCSVLTREAKRPA